jgi:phage FluMu protein Com
MKKSIQQQKDDESALRCLNCEKLLAKKKSSGHFEIKCLRCGTLNKLKSRKIEQIVITDPFGRILFINKAAEKITGYKLEEAITCKPRSIVSRLRT